MQKKRLSLSNFEEAVKQLHSTIDYDYGAVVAIANGGLHVADELLKHKKVPLYSVRISCYDGETKRKTPIVSIPHDLENKLKGKKVLVVDDLVDSGDSLQILKKHLTKTDHKSATIYCKPHSSIKPDYYVESTTDWVVFCWEAS